MGQVLLRALYLLRRPAVAVVALAVGIGGCALVRLPLFGVPGYELATAVAAALGLLGGVVGAAAAFQERRLIQGRDPRPAGAERSDSATVTAARAVGAALALNLAIAAVPFAAAVVYALTSSRCDPFAQIGFYPLLVIPSALLSSAVGVFCGLAAGGRFGAGLLYVFFFLLAAAVSIWPIYFGPQVFAYNAFAGFFPGPLYDEALRLPAALAWFRLETVLIAAFFCLFCGFCLSMKDGRLIRPHFRPGAFALLVLNGLAIFTLETEATRLGTRSTQAFVEERLGGSRDTAHFHLVYPRAKPREEVDRLAQDLEFRHGQVRDFLGDVSNTKVNVFVYRSPEEKEALVGAAHTQFAKPWRLELHVNDGPFPQAVLKHELTHVLAQRYGKGPFRITTRWGIVPLMGIVEGLAVAADNPAGELTLHEWAAGMRRQKLAPDIRTLLGPEGFYASAAARAYTYAGSFIRYLADTYGREKLQELYAAGDFQGAYGRTLDGLATEWEGMLDKLPLDEAAVNQAFARFREGSLFARACAREVALLSERAEEALGADPDAALGLYQRCAAIQPEEPAFEMGEVRALEALGRDGDALTRLEALRQRVANQPTLVAETWMATADLRVRMDQSPQAVEALRQVLALSPTAAVDRTVRVKLAGLQSKAVGPAIATYFQPGHDDVKLLVLREALQAEPDHPILLYLLGRRLAQGGVPKLAVGYLARALEKDLSPTLRREALRLKIESDYLAGDCDGVKNDVGHLPDLGAAVKAQAREWVERCEFDAKPRN